MAKNIEGVQTLETFTIENKTFYEKNLLKELQRNLHLAKFAKKAILPRNHGDTISWRTIKNLEVPTESITEGVVPEPSKLDIVEYKTTIKEEGSYIPLTDKIDFAGIDPIVTEASESLGYQAAERIDNIIRTELEKSVNVLYAGNATSRNGLTDTTKHIITNKDINKAVRILKTFNVKPLEGGDYVMLIHPDMEYELKSQEGNGSWLDISKYAASTKLLEGEIGKMLGVRFVVDNGISVIDNNVSGTTYKVYKNILLGKEGFGTVSLDGEAAKPKIIHQPLGSGGAYDPLYQIQTLGWKIEGFGARILRDEAVLIYECLSTLDELDEIEDENRTHFSSKNEGAEALSKTLETPVLTAGTNKVTWGVVTGADGYFVYSSPTSDGTFTLIGTTRATTQTVTGTEYYKVQAIASNGAISALSSAATKS